MCIQVHLAYFFVALLRMNKQGITVIIHTYNAAKHLEAVLKSVQGFDEVLVCDMESTDETLGIAARYGCRIITFARGTYNIVEPARQFAIERASCDWVLVVDADELVSAELRTYLYAHIQQADPAAGLAIPRRNYFMGRFMHAAYPDYVLRFFRRELTIWLPIIHASPRVEGEVLRIPRGRKGLALEHLANDSVHAILHKHNIYSDHELPKRAHKHYGLAALLLRPLARFVRSYLLKGGFRDGLPGLIHAGTDAIYQFVIVAKLIEGRRSKS